MTDHAPETLWHAVSGRSVPRPAPTGRHACDVLVIGGGFTGLSAALHAAEAGQSVIVLEAHRIAWGATGRNAGFVVPNFAKVDPDMVIARLGRERGERLVRFACGAGDLVFDLIARHAIACDAVRQGWIQVAATPQALARTHARAAQWAALGRPAEALDAAMAERLTGMRGGLGGWIDRSGGVLNPVRFARGLADAAEKAGARIFEGARVEAIASAGSDWAASTARSTVAARRVILATNAYSGALVRGLAQSFFPLRVFQIATHPLPPEVRQRLVPLGQGVADTRRNLFTYRFDAENRLITGGMHVVGPGAARRVPRALHARMALRLDLPDLPAIAYAWSGLAAVVPGFLPRIFSVAPGLVAVTACNGRGIALSTGAGAVLADWATGKPIEALAIPSSAIAPIRGHRLLRYAPNALLPVSILRDHIETRRR